MGRFTILFVLAAGAAFAHAGATGIVKDRMDGMKAIGAAMKDLAPMMKGAAEFDEERAAEISRLIAGHAGQNMLALFPEGSNHGVTEVAETVWSAPEEFERLAVELERLSLQIIEVDAQGRAALFDAMAQTCRDCHAGYRVSN